MKLYTMPSVKQGLTVTDEHQLIVLKMKRNFLHLFLMCFYFDEQGQSRSDFTGYTYKLFVQQRQKWNHICLCWTLFIPDVSLVVLWLHNDTILFQFGVNGYVWAVIHLCCVGECVYLMFWFWTLLNLEYELLMIYFSPYTNQP